MMTSYAWADVRAVPAGGLAVGDRCITPSTGTAYHVASDGSVVGVGWQSLDGTVWTVKHIDSVSGEVTATTEHDTVVSQTPNAGQTVLRFAS